jgi:hypothetical protein
MVPDVKKSIYSTKLRKNLTWYEICIYKGDSEMRQNSTVEDL